jgi:hypothetical protein
MWVKLNQRNDWVIFQYHEQEKLEGITLTPHEYSINQYHLQFGYRRLGRGRPHVHQCVE